LQYGGPAEIISWLGAAGVVVERGRRQQSPARCGKTATRGTKAAHADFLIFATQHGFVTKSFAFVTLPGSGECA
jgi:hypothetical protein